MLNKSHGLLFCKIVSSHSLSVAFVEFRREFFAVFFL